MFVCVFEVAIYKLKILGGRKLEYYESMGGTTKRGEPNILSSVGGSSWRRGRGGTRLLT